MTSQPYSSCGSQAPPRWRGCLTSFRVICRVTEWHQNGQLLRPLVLIYTAIAFAVTIIFRASVDAQAGAYATGVLVLMSSAALAVTLSAWRKRSDSWPIAVFAIIAVIFLYTTALIS